MLNSEEELDLDRESYDALPLAFDDSAQQTSVAANLFASTAAAGDSRSSSRGKSKGTGGARVRSSSKSSAGSRCSSRTGSSTSEAIARVHKQLLRLHNVLDEQGQSQVKSLEDLQSSCEDVKRRVHDAKLRFKEQYETLTDTVASKLAPASDAACGGSGSSSGSTLSWRPPSRGSLEAVLGVPHTRHEKLLEALELVACIPWKVHMRLLLQRVLNAWSSATVSTPDSDLVVISPRSRLRLVPHYHIADADEPVLSPSPSEKTFHGADWETVPEGEFLRCDGGSVSSRHSEEFVDASDFLEDTAVAAAALSLSTQHARLQADARFWSTEAIQLAEVSASVAQVPPELAAEVLATSELRAMEARATFWEMQALAYAEGASEAVSSSSTRLEDRALPSMPLCAPVTLEECTLREELQQGFDNLEVRSCISQEEATQARAAPAVLTKEGEPTGKGRSYTQPDHQDIRRDGPQDVALSPVAEMEQENMPSSCELDGEEASKAAEALGGGGGGGDCFPFGNSLVSTYLLDSTINATANTHGDTALADSSLSEVIDAEESKSVVLVVTPQPVNDAEVLAAEFDGVHLELEESSLQDLTSLAVSDEFVDCFEGSEISFFDVEEGLLVSPDVVAAPDEAAEAQELEEQLEPHSDEAQHPHSEDVGFEAAEAEVTQEGDVQDLLDEEAARAHASTAAVVVAEAPRTDGEPLVQDQEEMPELAQSCASSSHWCEVEAEAKISNAEPHGAQQLQNLETQDPGSLQVCEVLEVAGAEAEASVLSDSAAEVAEGPSAEAADTVILDSAAEAAEVRSLEAADAEAAFEDQVGEEVLSGLRDEAYDSIAPSDDYESFPGASEGSPTLPGPRPSEDVTLPPSAASQHCAAPAADSDVTPVRQLPRPSLSTHHEEKADEELEAESPAECLATKGPAAVAAENLDSTGSVQGSSPETPHGGSPEKLTADGGASRGIAAPLRLRWCAVSWRCCSRRKSTQQEERQPALLHDVQSGAAIRSGGDDCAKGDKHSPVAVEAGLDVSAVDLEFGHEQDFSAQVNEGSPTADAASP